MTSLIVDPDRQIEAAERYIAIAPLPESNPSDVRASILLEQTYPFPPRSVWDACSTATSLARWFAKVRPVNGEPNAFTIDGSAWGSVLHAIPERTISVTWNFDERTSVLDVDFTPPFDPQQIGRAVHISLSHGSNLTTEQWEQYGVIGVGVAWDVAAVRLIAYLNQGLEELTDGVFSQPSEPVLAELDEWSGSEEAQEFMSVCAQRWAAATIAAGVPADTAYRQLESTRDALIA